VGLVESYPREKRDLMFVMTTLAAVGPERIAIALGA
jgi:hypothetical protein